MSKRIAKKKQDYLYPVNTNRSELTDILSVMERLLYWAAIIESSDDAIISLDIEGNIRSWNKGAQEIYGYTSEEIIGKPISVLMPTGKKEDFSTILNRLYKGIKIVHYETKRQTKDGRTIDVSLTVSPIRDPHGDIIGASKIARDITERKLNEQKRIDLFSSISHELKTPLTSQKLFGDLLEKQILKNGDIKYKTYIQNINKQTGKLIQIINDLMEVTRSRTGRLTIEKHYFSFDEFIREQVYSTRLSSQHKIELKGKTNKTVFGDKARLGQVVTNLLSNAIKYSPNSDKVIVNVSAENSHVVVAVKDFGIGIPQIYHKRIFERFFRVFGSNEKEYTGLGIGLNLAKDIITRHRGKIWFTSKHGQGSTFFFSLPVSSRENGRRNATIDDAPAV